MPETAALLEIVEKLKAENPAWVSDVKDSLSEVTVIVPREHIGDACISMKQLHGFDMLADLCGVDRGPEEEPRFAVNYHLFSTKHKARIRLKVMVGEDDPHIPTVSFVWKTANWHERETFDMFGVIFDDHPDLRRILLPSDFDGHALRKDYPLRGYEPYSVS